MALFSFYLFWFNVNIEMRIKCSIHMCLYRCISFLQEAAHNSIIFFPFYFLSMVTKNVFPLSECKIHEEGPCLSNPCPIPSAETLYFKYDVEYKVNIDFMHSTQIKNI